MEKQVSIIAEMRKELEEWKRKEKRLIAEKEELRERAKELEKELEGKEIREKGEGKRVIEDIEKRGNFEGRLQKLERNLE